MLHTTIGYYPNGDYKVNGVPSEDIASHIWYNITFRPGRLFIVDGYCVHRGTFSYDSCKEIVEKLKDIKSEKISKTYV